jgi:catechol 2,3-dioxygenase-like lactoylglutathione lyase family enzyme
MDDTLAKLFKDFDRGNISRRQLLQVLGIAAVSVPVAAYAQGRCGGANAGSAACDTTPDKAPFAPTGWRTVSLDHFTMHAVDYQKEAAYYAALMNWKVRSDDGNQAVLDIGDWGGAVIKGGYEPPPPPPAPANDAGAGGGGRGGRGGRGGGRGGPRAPRNVVWSSFCWGIAPWDAKSVEAELRKRGLDPVAENGAGGFESFHVKDPGGFDLQISNGAAARNRRRSPANGKLAVAAPFEHTNWKTVWLDHISFSVPNYKASTAFYQALLGWKPLGDEGSQNEVEIGDVGNAIIRGGNPAAPAAAAAPGRGGFTPREASIDHCAFGITPWDSDVVLAELTKRGLTARPDTGGKGDIHDEAAHYKSYHTTTPEGFDLQVSNSDRAHRTVR